MSSLVGQKVRLTFKDLLQVSNSNSGIDASLRTVTDGEATSSPLQLSTTQISLNGSVWPTGYGNASQVLGTDGAGTLSWVNQSGGGGTLDDLTDVTITGVASSNVLQYNGAAWVNLSLAGAGISAVGHTHVAANITDLATAAVAFTNKTGAISQWTNDSGYLTAVPTQTVITVANEATDTTCFPAFFTAATGDLGPKTNAGLTFNSNTGVLAATGFSGPLTGNVTGNADTVTTNANLTGPITSVGNATSIASQTGTGTKFVVDTSPTLVTPVLGVATATTINKVALTAPATGSTLTIADGQTLTVNGSATITNGTHSGTNTGDQNLFSTIAVAGQSDIVADAASDTLTIVAGANITLTTNAGTDTLTIAAGAGGSLSDADYGDVTVSGGGTVFTVDSVTVADAAADTTTWPMLSRSVTGSNQVVSTDAGLTYDASTNNLATTTFTGALVGNVTGNVSGSSGSTTGNAATVTTNANLTGPITSVGNATSIASQTGTGTKFVVDTSPTLVTPVLGVATATSINTAVITAPTTTVGGNIKLLEGTNNGTNTLTIQAPASTADVTATFQAVTGDIYVSGGTDIPVADGGTGLSSTTAYAVLCGGTTSTSALQSIASVGTSGHVLTSNGAGALPTFQAAAGGNWVKISSSTASASATIDFTGLSSTYRTFAIVLSDIAPATDAVNLYIRTSTDNGSTYDSGASDYKYNTTTTSGSATISNGTGNAQLLVGLTVGNSTNEKTSGIVYLHNPQGTTGAVLTWHVNGMSPSNLAQNMIGCGIRMASADVDAIRFLFSSGNIASGTFTLYGITA